MRSQRDVDEVLRRHRLGSSASDAARELGIPRTTVRDWLNGRTPRRPAPETCRICDGTGISPTVRDAYAYLLGLYLGDGCISAHRRGVYKLRISLDEAYPAIIADGMTAITAVRGRPAAQRHCATACVEVYSYWKHWPCLLPQHGPGMKHLRPIVLADWQQELVDRSPQPLLRGLIHSDGCRAINTGRGGWSHPRYSFSNRSQDIHAIFRDACDRLGVRWTVARPYTTYVSRVADVAALDAFIGPKG